MTVIEQRAYEAIISMAKKNEPDYWEKLKHQAAISAMQGILSNPQIWKGWDEAGLITKDLEVSDMANYFATALVKKLKSGGK